MLYSYPKTVVKYKYIALIAVFFIFHYIFVFVYVLLDPQQGNEST
jgi:hypothetical protein